MRTSLQWTILAAAVVGSSYLSHLYWPTHAQASPAGAEACSAALAAGPGPATWRIEGFRDDERCDFYGDPPGCP